MSALMAPSIAPVEYAVAVDRYLAEAELGCRSRRVYRISLAGWAWPLVGRPRPAGRAAGGGRARRSSRWLSWIREDAAAGLAGAIATRLRQAEVRTVSRELSALRSAIGWWRRQQWIAADPTVGLDSGQERPDAARPLTEAEVARAVPHSGGAARAGVVASAARQRRERPDCALGLDAQHWICAAAEPRATRRQAVEWGTAYQRPAQLAARGPTARAGIPHRPARARWHASRRHLPAERPRPDVLPAGG